MKQLQGLEKRIRGWIPKEPTVPHNKVTHLNLASPPKIVRIIIIFSILALIIAAVIILYVPFYASQSALYRGGLVVAIAIVNTIIAYTFRKVLPKPTSRDRKLQLISLVVILSIAFTVGWLMRGQ